MPETLFAVCLGGSAQKSNTELHDIVFVTGDSIEATYIQLLEKWFGAPDDLHIDSWIALQSVDDYQITLSHEPSPGPDKLYFVNLGGYADGKFMELHANIFLVAATPAAAKSRAKTLLRPEIPTELHTDDLHQVDDCLDISALAGRHIHLVKSGGASTPRPINGYHIIPEAIIQNFIQGALS